MSEVFSTETLERIEHSVHWTEKNLFPAQQIGPATGLPHQSGEELAIFKLTSVLSQGSSASAHPWEWNASAGAYAPDNGTTVVVKDTLNSFLGSSGSLVLCRFLGNADGTVIREVLSAFPSGDILCFGLTTASFATSAGSFTVDHITNAGRCGSPTNDSADTMTIDNWAGWSSSASGVQCMFVVVSITGKPGSGSNIGSGNFIQGPCSASS